MKTINTRLATVLTLTVLATALFAAPQAYWLGLSDAHLSIITSNASELESKGLQASGSRRALPGQEQSIPHIRLYPQREEPIS